MHAINSSSSSSMAIKAFNNRLVIAGWSIASRIRSAPLTFCNRRLFSQVANSIFFLLFQKQRTDKFTFCLHKSKWCILCCYFIWPYEMSKWRFRKFEHSSTQIHTYIHTLHACISAIVYSAISWHSKFNCTFVLFH